MLRKILIQKYDMDTIQKSLQSFVFPFALYAGLTRVIIDIVPKLLGLNNVYYFSFYICLILEILLIIYVTKHYKTANKNNLTSQEGLKIGIIIMMVIGILFSISSFVYDTYINPVFQKNIIENLNNEIVLATKNKIEEGQKNPSILGVFFVIIRFIMTGFLISAITTSFFKTKTDN